MNQQDNISKATLLVYSNVENWKAISISTNINSYAGLEKLVEATAKENGYDTELPFAFRINAVPAKATYHVIDWKKGVEHTMDNHNQFAYSGEMTGSPVIMLGFYSKHHQSIFTHHSTFMHVHLLDEKTNTVGHLDELNINGLLTIYLPVK